MNLQNTHLYLNYLLLLWRAVAAPLAWAVLLGVQGVAAARKCFVQRQLLVADLPPSQINPGSTPQLEAHVHIYLINMNNPGIPATERSPHLPVGILLHQGATVNRDGHVLHAVVLLLVSGLQRRR